MHQNFPLSLLNLVLTPRVSDSVGLEGREHAFLTRSQTVLGPVSTGPYSENHRLKCKLGPEEMSRERFQFNAVSTSDHYGSPERRAQGNF